MTKAIILDVQGVLYVHGELNENIAAFVREHKDQFVFAIASASGQWVRERLQEDDLIQFFTLVVTADDIRLSKADPKLYTYIAKELNLEPEEMLFIDDVASFCQAARKAGVRAIHYTNPEDFAIGHQH